MTSATEAAPPAAETQAAGSRAGRREAAAEIGARALGAHRTLEVDDRPLGDDRPIRVRDLDRLPLLGLEQLLQRIVVLRTDVLGHVLDREDLPGALLAEPHAAAGAESEPRSDAEAEAAADPGHIEHDRKDQEDVKKRRAAQGLGQAPGPRAEGRRG
jgi:hypothetical protein